MVGIAQLVERLVVVQDVAGSSPVTHPNVLHVHQRISVWQTIFVKLYSRNLNIFVLIFELANNTLVTKRFKLPESISSNLVLATFGLSTAILKGRTK